MKKSIYNIEVDRLDGNNVLLFNSLTGSLGIMDGKGERILESIDSFDYGSAADSDLSIIDVFKQNGFIVDDEFDELNFIKTRQNLSIYGNPNKSLSLTIAPTLNCNMQCPYCFEDKNYTRMDDNIKSSIIKYIEKHLHDIRNLGIVWYGGEPLLEKEIIYDLSLELLRICKERNVNYYASIVTNGYFLDYETAVCLREKCKINYAQVTIDGLRDTHNKRRRLKNGQGSFDTIIENIDIVKDIIPISIRVNIDKTNLNEAEPLLNFLMNKEGWKDKVGLYFAQVEACSDFCGIENNSCLVKDEFSKVNSALINKMYEYGYVKNIARLMPKPLHTPCGSIKTNSFVIDPNGNLYKCWNVIGDSRYIVGNIFGDFNMLGSKHIQWINQELAEKCTLCNLLPLCMGGCVSLKLRNGEPNCYGQVLGIKEYLKVIHKSYVDYKEQKVNS